MADSDLIEPFPWPKVRDNLGYMRICVWLLLTGMHVEGGMLLEDFKLTSDEVETFEKLIAGGDDPMIVGEAIWALSLNTGSDVAEILHRVSLMNPKVGFYYAYGADWQKYLDWDVSLSPVAYVSDFHSQLIRSIESPSLPAVDTPCHVFSMYLKSKKLKNQPVPVIPFSQIWKYRYCKRVMNFLINDGQLGFWRRILLIGPLIKIHSRIIGIGHQLYRLSKRKGKNAVPGE